MKNEKIKRMTGIALLMAMVVVLQFVGGLIPPIGGAVSISLVLIPIVVGGAVFGPGAGGLLGAAFGIIANINCATGSDPGGAMVFQASPILCILVVMVKGTLAGLCAGWVYKLIRKKSNGYAAMLCAAITCPVVNTGLFLIGMSLFFMDVLKTWAGGTGVLSYVLTGSIMINFIAELIINVVFSPAGQRIVHTIKHGS